MKEQDLNTRLYNQIKKNKDKKIILYGASIFLYEFLQRYPLEDFNIIGIIDRDSKKWGKKYGKYEIYSPNSLKELKPDYAIITIENLNKEIILEIKKYFKKNYPNIKLLPPILYNCKNKYIRHKWLLKFIDFFIPKDNKKIVFLSTPDFSDNAKEYYEYLKNNHDNKYELIWLYRDFENCQFTKIKNKHSLYSLKGIWQIICSKYLVITHTSFLTDTFSLNKHIVLQLWHGMPIKTLGYLEKSGTSDLLNKYKEAGKNEHFFVTSDIFKLAMIPCFLMNPNKIHITGQPRTDCIFNNRNKKEIAEYINAKKYNKIIIYAPTYKEALRNNQRDIQSKFKNIFYCNDYSEKDFYNFLEENNILFIVKPHPFDEKFYINHLFEGKFNHSNLKFVFDKDLKKNDFYFYEFFALADLMITDYSSIAIDYLITQKPIIFLESTLEEYSQNRSFILEDNYEIVMSGEKVYNFKELLITIQDSLTIDSYKEKRLEKLPLLHKYTDSYSSERIYQIMKNL